MKPTAATTADQTRQLGMRVGDTIEGREDWGNGRGQVTRLTLLWAGETEAVFSEASCLPHLSDKWRAPVESSNWTLKYRDWQIIARAEFPVTGLEPRGCPAPGACSCPPPEVLP
jgi:hypothetical protein